MRVCFNDVYCRQEADSDNSATLDFYITHLAIKEDKQLIYHCLCKCYVTLKHLPERAGMGKEKKEEVSAKVIIIITVYVCESHTSQYTKHNLC